MKRPHIPLSVRVQVAERQCAALNDTFWKLYQSRLLCPTKYPLKDRLEALLYHLFGTVVSQLDHDPALILRPINTVTGDYMPPANDPNHLVYRTKLEHLEKTIGRKQDALRTVTTKGSDAWLAKKFRKLEKVTLTELEERIATDGTIVWNLGHPQEGKPIGIDEMKRRKMILAPYIRKGKIASRPFPKTKRPFRSKHV